MKYETLHQIEYCLKRANDVMRSKTLTPNERWRMAREYLILARSYERSDALNEFIADFEQ